MVKPSYSCKQLMDILSKLAEGRCDWFSEEKLRSLAETAILNKELCTPWTIRDFVLSSQGVSKERDLKEHICSRSSENSLNFAYEISNSTFADQLLFCLIYLLGTHESSSLSSWHANARKRIQALGMDVGHSTFAEQLRSHLGFRIEQFGSTRLGIRFTHPIYEEAVAQAAARHRDTLAIMAEVLQAVQDESFGLAVSAVARDSVKHPLLASRLFDLMVGSGKRKLSKERGVILGEKLASAYRNTKFPAYLDVLSRATNPVRLVKMINGDSHLGELPRYLRLARHYQELLPGKYEIDLGKKIDWRGMFRRLACRPKLGPWARVVESALWFDREAPVEFLSALPPTLLRTRFLQLAANERRGVLKALKGSDLFERLCRLEGAPGEKLADLSSTEVMRNLEARALDSGIVADEGALEALKVRRLNLLPPGILRSEGSFHECDVVSIFARDGSRVGLAVSEYSSDEIDAIKGFHSSQIAEILGYRRGDEVVRREEFCPIPNPRARPAATSAR